MVIVGIIIWFFISMFLSAMLSGGVELGWVIFFIVPIIMIAIAPLLGSDNTENHPTPSPITKPKKYKYNNTTQVKKINVVFKPLKARLDTQDLISRYNYYCTLSDEIIKNHKEFNWDNELKHYTKSNFLFNQKVPIKTNFEFIVPELDVVPEETFIEKLFRFKSKKTLEIISRNEYEIERVANINAENEKISENDYKKQVAQYLVDFLADKANWEIKEKLREQEYNLHNEKIHKLIDGYKNKNQKIIIEYVNTLFNKNNIFIEPIINIDVGYNEFINKLAIDVNLEKRETIFPISGYKYIAKYDSIKELRIPIAEQNDKFKKLIRELSLTMIYLLYQNNHEDYFDVIAINTFCNQTCCGSCQVTKIEFEKLEVNNFNKDVFVLENLRLFNRINTGVTKPFDTLGNLD